MKEKKKIKTNAMRILDKANISYDVYTYPHNNIAINGERVAELLQQDPRQVFKTLVTIANTKEYYVFVIPVIYELDLKKCAVAVHVKSLEMIHVKDIQMVTGYIRGGCSPIGMKKQFTTCIHLSCLDFDTIIFSGGQIGCQIAISADALRTLLTAMVADIVKN